MSKTTLNKKTLLQVGVTVVALGLSGWMALGMFTTGSDIEEVHNPVTSSIEKSDDGLTTKIVPHPEPVSLNTYVANNKDIQSEFIDEATITINNKLKTYRESQLEAMTAENLATVREAKARGVSLPVVLPSVIEKPREPEPTPKLVTSEVIDYIDKPASPIESAVLSYFDPQSKSAYINVNGRTYKANEGSTISSLTITSISYEGVTVSSHGRTKLLTSNKGYSMPDKIVIEDTKKIVKSGTKAGE